MDDRELAILALRAVGITAVPWEGTIGNGTGLMLWEGNKCLGSDRLGWSIAGLVLERLAAMGCRPALSFTHERWWLDCGGASGQIDLNPVRAVLLGACEVGQ